MAGHEDQVAVLAAVGAPLQVMLDLDRFVVLVDAEETDVEVEARILEVVRITAVEGDLLFRSEDETNVGVPLEEIEVILAARVEGDDLRLEAGLLGFRLDLIDDGPARE